MSRCRKIQELFPGSIYGDLDPADEGRLARHLDDCLDCRTEYDAMARALLALGARKRADPGPAFWDGYYDALQKRMVAEGEFAPGQSRPAAAPRRSLPRWVLASAGAAGLLAAGILIGRLTLPRGAEIARTQGAAVVGTEPAPAVVSADLSDRTSRYLNRSKVILLAISNFDPKTKDVAGLNLAGQRSSSRELVKEASVLKDDLRAARERRLERLVGELELILGQIANLKSETDVPGVEIVKAGVDLKDVLFKINMSEVKKTVPSAKTAPRPSAKI
jgi:hypothetical protein